MQQYITMGSVLSELFSTYGIDILKDGNRLCSVFGDIAPSLEKERKILRRAKDEGIFCLLLNAYQADTSKRASIISKIEYTLKSEAGFSDEWYQILLTGFSEAFSWILPAINPAIVAPVATVPTAPVTRKKYFTKNIARNTFSTSPKQIVLPEKYNAVGEHAFDYIGLSVHVDSVTIPNGYIEIQRYAFHPLKIDHYISIPDSVVEIADNAFTLEKYAYVLCSPNSYAYQYCSKHYLSNSVDGIPVRPGQNRLSNDYPVDIQLVKGPKGNALRTLVIPKGTTSVEKGTFRNRDDIECTLADNNLMFIKKGAFSGCKSLQYVVLGSGTQSIASEAFSHCTELKAVYIDFPGDYGKEFAELMDKESPKLNISESAFDHCQSLGYIVSNEYSSELDEFCRSAQIEYIYDDLTLQKSNRSHFSKDIQYMASWLAGLHARWILGENVHEE